MYIIYIYIYCPCMGSNDTSPPVSQTRTQPPAHELRTRYPAVVSACAPGTSESLDLVQVPDLKEASWMMGKYMGDPLKVHFRNWPHRFEEYCHFIIFYLLHDVYTWDILKIVWQMYVRLLGLFVWSLSLNLFADVSACIFAVCLRMFKVGIATWQIDGFLQIQKKNLRSGT